MSKVVVLLNGPANSGKDVLAGMLIAKLGGVKQQFKDALYKHTADLYQMELSTFVKLATGRGTKELPTPSLQGYSPREALIFTSEKVYKPIYGQDYFGKYTAAKLEEGYNYVADSGFIDEAETVVEEVPKTLLVRIRREGCTFEGDSRNYINLDHKDTPSLDLYNNGTLEEARDIIIKFMEDNGCLL
jgi:hypothetical protein